MSFSSKRLMYEKCQPHESALYEQMATQEAVMQFVTGKALTPNEAQERYKMMLSLGESDEKYGYYFARKLESNHLLGLIKYVPFNATHHEVGYLVLPEYWGQKFATEMVQSMIDYAQNDDTIQQLIALVIAQNIASLKVLEKFNFSIIETKETESETLLHLALVL